MEVSFQSNIKSSCVYTLPFKQRNIEEKYLGISKPIYNPLIHLLKVSFLLYFTKSILTVHHSSCLKNMFHNWTFLLTENNIRCIFLVLFLIVSKVFNTKITTSGLNEYRQKNSNHSRSYNSSFFCIFTRTGYTNVILIVSCSIFLFFECVPSVY